LPRVSSLGEGRLRTALAIALAHASPSVGRQSGTSMSRWLAIATPRATGVAAALARKRDSPVI